MHLKFVTRQPGGQQCHLLFGTTLVERRDDLENFYHF
jgi:hypothetical protein